MKKNLIKGLVIMTAVLTLFFTVSCAEKEVKSTPTPEAPQVNVTDENQEETAVQPEEEASQEINEKELEAEAVRREKEKARTMFVNENVYFDYDDSSLQSASQDILKRKSLWLNNNPEASVIIEGHCDERGSARYNLALGERRAQSVKTFLENLGIDASRLTTISYGEEMPVDPGHNEDAWAKNRRAHFRIK